MNKVWVLIFGIIVVLATVKAATALPQLTVDISGEIKVFSGEDNFESVRLSNVGDQALYNVTFSDMRATFFPEIAVIEPGEEVDVNLRISPGEPFREDYVLTMEFLYEISEPPIPKVVEVDIRDDEFDPKDIDLFYNDTIQFNNIGEDTVVIKEFDDKFTLSISGGTSKSYTFLDEGDFKVFKEGEGFTANIHVTQGEVGSFAHSNNLDIKKNVKLVSEYRPGDLVINLLTGSFNLTHDGFGEGILDIKNIGDGIARNIRLEGDWFEFEEEGFDLNPQQNKIVNFNVTPGNFTNKEETGIYYEKLITATSDSADEGSTQVQVFIQFFDFNLFESGGVTVSITQLDINGTLAYCNNPAGSHDPRCKDLQIEVAREVIVEKNRTIGLSEQEIESFKEGADKVGDSADRIENKFDVVADDVGTIDDRLEKMESAVTSLSTSVIDFIDNDNAVNKKRRIRNWIFSILIIIIIGGASGFILHRNYKYKKKVHDNLYDIQEP